MEIKSVGEQVIRTNFSANDEIAKLKNEYATLFNSITGLITWRNLTDKDAEEIRCIQEAQKYLELSAMMAVKGATVRL